MAGVTVVIPAYNCARYVGHAIESALIQSPRPHEVIVVDDGSRDDTPRLVHQFGRRVRYIWQPNAGAAQARERAIAEARTEYIALLDADDVWLPGKLSRQLAVLESNSRIVVCGCQADVINVDGDSIGSLSYPCSDSAVRFQSMFRCAVPNSGAVVRRDAFYRVGGYCASMAPAEDYDLWTRLLSLGMITNVGAPLVQYRVNPDGLSQLQRRRQDEKRDCISATYMLSMGVTQEPCEACEFALALRVLHTDIVAVPPERHGERACEAFERFVACRADLASLDLSGIRKELRWVMLRQAEKHSVMSRQFWTWMRFACRVDPIEMRPARMLQRKMAHLTTRVLAQGTTDGSGIG